MTIKSMTYRGTRMFANVIWSKDDRGYYAEVSDNNGETRATTRTCMSRGGAWLEARRVMKEVIDRDGGK